MKEFHFRAATALLPASLPAAPVVDRARSIHPGPSL
jgi:hypothetical protein